MLCVVLAASAGVGWWAGRTTLLTVGQSVAGTGPAPVTSTVVEGTVGRTLSVGVTLRQSAVVVATNSLAGIVTEVTPAAEVTVGAVLYAVAGTPVRAVTGDTPFYRPLARGTNGPDVEQLQRALAELGYLSSTPDGDFGPATEAAVRAWQSDLGVPRTGAVPLGEVLAIPGLPASIRLGDKIRTGLSISGGEEAVLASTGDQEFVILPAESQVAALTRDVLVRVSFEGRTWDSHVAGSTVDENDQLVLDLRGPDGGPVCGADCGSLPPDERVSLRGEAVVVPEVSGPTVPASAVRTDTDGTTYVRLAEGVRRDVVVRGSGQGLVVVEGLVVGEVVILSGDGSPSDESASGPSSRGLTHATGPQGA